MRAVQPELHDVQTRCRRGLREHEPRAIGGDGCGVLDIGTLGQPRDVAAAVGGLREEIHRVRPRRAEEELAAIGRPDREDVDPRVEGRAREPCARARSNSQMSIC